MAFLRKFFYILFLVGQISFSQIEIDTSSVIKQKIEYHIDTSSEDTIKWSRTRYYESGLIKQLIYLDSGKVDISIFSYEVKPFEFDKDSKLVYLEIGEDQNKVKIRNYYNKNGILDSTLTRVGSNENTPTLFIATKKYNLFGKIKKLKTWEGVYTYNYDLLGKKKKINFTSNSSNKTKYYKNGLLERIESKNPLIKIDSIKYNSSNKPIRIDKGGEYLIFDYNDSGRLIEKANYWKNEKAGKDYLLEQEIYHYDQQNLKLIESYNRKSRKTYITYLVYKNAT